MSTDNDNIYYITERLVVDTDLMFEIDIDRCIELINQHRNVACGTFEEAEKILLGLGMTDASIRILFGRAVGLNDMESSDAVELPR